jgi:hypothetical protein
MTEKDLFAYYYYIISNLDTTNKDKVPAYQKNVSYITVLGIISTEVFTVRKLLKKVNIILESTVFITL